MTESPGAVKRPAVVSVILAFVYYFFNHVVTRIPLYSVRHAYLRRILRMRIGEGSSVHMGCFMTGRNISIGRNSVINRNCYLDGRVGIEIGNNVGVSPEVYVLSLTHDVYDEQFGTIGAKVILEDYVWIGARAMLMPGIRLSEGCVVGAGSVVTKSFEKYSIIAGVPAREIGRRAIAPKYSLRYFPYFDTDVQ